MEITLEQLLMSRDERKRQQTELLSGINSGTLICLTVVMPGNVKRNRFSLITANAAIQAIDKKFSQNILYKQTKDLITGFEAYFITDIPPLQAKKMCCEIEQTHPLGRLFDIDVMGKDGIPINRESLGFEKRKCLICNNESRYCMRNFSHTQEEIQSHIASIINNYIRNNPSEDISDI